MTLAIDPGISTLGYAFGDDETRKVIKAGLIKCDVKGPTTTRASEIASELWARFYGMNPSTLVFEWPQVYQGAQQKGETATLIEGGIEHGMLSMDSFAWGLASATH